jgi:hypothetical protein
MACELGFLYSPDEVFLVTSDKRMQSVANQLKTTPDKAKEEKRVDRDFGFPQRSRWTVPGVIYVPNVRSTDLPRIQGQSIENF